MHTISKILSVVDPTTVDQPALQRASWLAESTGAEIELLVCYYNEYLSGDRLFDSPSLEKAHFWFLFVVGEGFGVYCLQLTVLRDKRRYQWPPRRTKWIMV